MSQTVTTGIFTASLRNINSDENTNFYAFFQSYASITPGISGGALPARVYAAGAAVAIVLALASGLPPAWRAHRLTIVDALAGR